MKQPPKAFPLRALQQRVNRLTYEHVIRRVVAEKRVKPQEAAAWFGIMPDISEAAA